ncbi:MAG: ferrous iron transport protein A [Ruminococcus sp.]|nr:ferrous iron transport protein A [Ruminococcus sp.]
MKNNDNTTLDCVDIDDICYVTYISEDLSENEKRMYDLGLTNGTLVKPIFKSIFGDTVAYLIKGSVIALRKSDAKKIHVTFWR